MNVYKIADWVANSVHPDQTPRSAASDLCLHCLLRLVYPNTLSKYANLIKSNPSEIILAPTLLLAKTWNSQHIYAIWYECLLYVCRNFGFYGYPEYLHSLSPCQICVLFLGGGWLRRRCRVSYRYVTRVPNWYWLTVGQNLLSLLQVRVEGECSNFFCFVTFFHLPLSPLSFSFISSAISSISFLPFPGRRHKMTHKGWRVV